MRSISNSFEKASPIRTSPLLALFLTVSCLGLSGHAALAAEIHDAARFPNAKDYSTVRDWNLKGENLVPFGHNPLFFPLRPGHKHIHERPDSPDGYYRKETVVLDTTEPFDVPGIGKFEAATVREEEFYDGRFTQQALNWFAFDKTTGSVYEFGEVSWEVDEEGNRVFSGTWRAGEPDGNGLAEPGLLMPGTFTIGGRYLFDGSESESFGGAENIEDGMTVTVPVGTFHNCVRVREQGLHDVKDITDKVYCPGVGLVSDTTDGVLIATDVLPGADLSSIGKHHRDRPPAFKPPVAKVNGNQATAIALKVIPGKANSVAIERKRGHNVYVVEIIAKEDGVERDVFVDIETGEVVGTD
jgi:peptidase YpeB-like protein